MSVRKLIIFDFDGVLREMSWMRMHDAYRISIEFHGKKADDYFTDLVSFKKWYNIDWRKNVGSIFAGTNVTCDQFNEVFDDNYFQYLQVFPWGEEVILSLSKKYKLAIVSSSYKKAVEESLGDLKKYFTIIIGADSVKNLKPDTEGINIVLKETKFLADEAIMIGDMHVDYQAGKDAGLMTGLVKWGMGDWDYLCSLKPDILFEEPSELLSL